MHTTAAVLWGVGEPWSVEEVVLDEEPGYGEVLVRIAASGLCHSDDHVAQGDMVRPLPYLGGHEGSGVVEAVGPGLARLKPGDHVVLAFNPPCGRCRNCGRGQSNLCEMNYRTDVPAPRNHFHARGRELNAAAELGTFSGYTMVNEGCVIKIDDDVPLASASLLGCAVTTGWGAAVYLGDVRPGDNVVVIGTGGVGMNSIQGAHIAGADLVVAVDTSEFKREQALTFGATHAVADLEEAQELVAGLTAGRMADVVILAVGLASGDIIRPMMATIGLAGRAVITSVSPNSDVRPDLALFDFTVTQQSVRGNMCGGVNVHRDIPLLLGLYRRGKLKLDELITQTYALEDINQGYADMRSGKNLRGVLLLDA